MAMVLASSSFFFFFFFFFFLFFLANSSLSPPLDLSSSVLIPPLGNSLFIKTRAENGYVHYRCFSNNKWVAIAMSTDLLDLHNNNIVGKYSHVKHPLLDPRNAGTWTILNNEGDHAESGHPSSLVTGTQISIAEPKTTYDLPDTLALATNHTFEGTLSMVSYIARVNTQGGLLQNGETCNRTIDNKLVKVPFTSEFHFWKQDLVPPSMPRTLVLESQRPIEGFYGQGVIMYIYDGIEWKEKSVNAKMYDVPGGVLLGSFFTRSVPDEKGGTYCWHLDNPDGFTIVGKLACKPEPVSPDCLPWSLNVITSSNGNLTNFGPYTHVQVLSTKGGLPPTRLPIGHQKGDIWRSPFSAIFWFYSNM